MCVWGGGGAGGGGHCTYTLRYLQSETQERVYIFDPLTIVLFATWDLTRCAMCNVISNLVDILGLHVLWIVLNNNKKIFSKQIMKYG